MINSKYLMAILRKTGLDIYIEDLVTIKSSYSDFLDCAQYITGEMNWIHKNSYLFFLTPSRTFDLIETYLKTYHLDSWPKVELEYNRAYWYLRDIKIGLE